MTLVSNNVNDSIVQLKAPVRVSPLRWTNNGFTIFCDVISLQNRVSSSYDVSMTLVSYKMENQIKCEFEEH